MNIENMTALRDFLLTLPKKNFQHARWTGNSHAATPVIVKDHNVCGTAACIGGWAVIVGDLAPYEVNEHNQIEFPTDDIDFGELGAAWLGLDRENAGKLFWPWEINSDARDRYDDWIDSRTTNEEAAKFITLCIKNEDVRLKYWKEARGGNDE